MSKIHSWSEPGRVNWRFTRSPAVRVWCLSRGTTAAGQAFEARITHQHLHRAVPDGDAQSPATGIDHLRADLAVQGPEHTPSAIPNPRTARRIPRTRSTGSLARSPGGRHRPLAHPR